MIIKRSKDKYRAVFQKSVDALLIVDGTTGKILEANQATKAILGYNEKDLVGKKFSVLFPPKSELSGKDRMENIKVYGAVFVEEFRLADGSSCEMDVTFTMIPWGREKAILVTFRDPSERIRAEREREKLISELQDALTKIKTLKGLLPICASCKKIRDDQGYWHQVESYIRDHSQADFSHGICPDCQKRLYPGLYDEDSEN